MKYQNLYDSMTKLLRKGICMIRFLLILLSLFIVFGSVSAKNCHNNGRYNNCSYSYYHCDDDDDDDYHKCARRNYKRWAKRCHKYQGCDCSYNFWYGNRDWDDDDWEDYWDSKTYRNLRKVNRKVNLFRHVVDSTKELFSW